VRDARYCEIIPIVRDRLHLEATVYNTSVSTTVPRRSGTASPRRP
jgi:hypothetical protein